MFVRRSSVLLLCALLAPALALRLLALAVDGHDGDVRVMAGWAERMVEVGPWRFYDNSGAIYPALLYPLGLLGATFDGSALHLAIKAMSIPFDIALGTLLFAFGLSRGERWAAAVSGLYLFNPAVIIAGPAWGQVDAAGALPYLGALLASAARRDGLAGGLAVVAALVKPQFGLVALPVLVVAVLHARADRRVEPILRAGAGMAVGYLLVALPLALHPLRYLPLLADAATRQPETSLNAFNHWGLLVGFDLPDGPYVGIGSLLLVLGLAGSVVGLRRGTDQANMLAAGALVALAFYFLPTRVHERYLFAAMAVLPPFAASGRAPLAAYVALSLGFAAGLLYALHTTTSFDLPEPIASLATSPVGVWTIGLVMIGSAVAWAWLLGVRRPRLPDPRS